MSPLVARCVIKFVFNDQVRIRNPNLQDRLMKINQNQKTIRIILNKDVQTKSLKCCLLKTLTKKGFGFIIRSVSIWLILLKVDDEANCGKNWKESIGESKKVCYWFSRCLPFIRHILQNQWQKEHNLSEDDVLKVMKTFLSCIVFV